MATIVAIPVIVALVWAVVPLGLTDPPASLLLLPSTAVASLAGVVTHWFWADLGGWAIVVVSIVSFFA